MKLYLLVFLLSIIAVGFAEGDNVTDSISNSSDYNGDNIGSVVITEETSQSNNVSESDSDSESDESDSVSDSDDNESDDSDSESDSDSVSDSDDSESDSDDSESDSDDSESDSDDSESDSDDTASVGSAVGTEETRRIWWNNLSEIRKTRLSGLFDADWFNNGIDEATQIAYARTAQDVYDFLDAGKDSNPFDSYVGFAPLLLRSSFHSAGSFTHGTGTGGTNGGTIFNHAELADKQNGCIEVATKEMFNLFHGNSMVPLSDIIVIAGVVALDVMDFPRMDLISITGGRDMVQNIAHRDRLPEVDDDPLEQFIKQYNLTVSQTVAIIGGAHNFGSAHAKCSLYQGQWTSTPLSWFGPGGSDPTFFPDLMRDDWRWYKVCSFENNTVAYTSMDDPFAGGGEPESSSDSDDDSEDDGGEGACQASQSLEPFGCESQALGGCEFEDGIYSTSDSPCDVNLLQMRLKSDFRLKTNPKMLPFAEKFAEDPALLAKEFGIAYQKIVHNGLERCGLSGHGCPEGYTCERVGDESLTDSCMSIPLEYPSPYPATVPVGFPTASPVSTPEPTTGDGDGYFSKKAHKHNKGKKKQKEHKKEE